MANERARRLRKTMTPQEVKLWVRLRELRELGLHFHRQSPITSYIVDFECRRARLIVEVDGGQHSMELNLVCDRARDAQLNRAGYQVLRFWNHEIDQELDAVIETVVRSAKVLPHPAASASRRRPPSPKGEG